MLFYSDLQLFVVMKRCFLKELWFYCCLFLILVFTITSCEYEPFGVYERITESNAVAPEIQIIELDLNEDTIFYYTNQLKIIFNLSSSDQVINDIRFIVDDEIQGIYREVQGQFDFENIELSPGTHSLTMEVYTHTGSLSIADLLEMECFLFSNTWVLQAVDIDSIETKAEAENGFLKLTFPEYKNSDFREYHIYRVFNGTEKLVAVTQNNIYIDSSYVGEGSQYKSVVLMEPGDSISWTDVTLECELPVQSFHATNDNVYSIRWTKTKYYNAISEYYFVDHNNSTREDTAFSITNRNDTIIYPGYIIYNESRTVTMRTVPKRENPFYCVSSYELYQTEQKFFAGIPLVFAPGSTFFTINDDEIVYSYGDTLFRCSVSDNKMLEKAGFYNARFSDLQVSPMDINLSAHDNNNESIFISSANDFQHYLESTDTSITDIRDYSIPMSDIGTGILATSDSLYVYDFIKSKKLAVKFRSKERATKISSDGEYFFTRGDSVKLYRYHDNTIDLVWKTNSTLSYYEFYPENPDLLVVYIGYYFYIRNCSDFSIANRFLFNCRQITNVDFYRKQLLIKNTHDLWVMDLTDGHLICKVPINISYSTYFIFNDMVISREGIAYRLNTQE